MPFYCCMSFSLLSSTLPLRLRLWNASCIYDLVALTAAVATDWLFWDCRTSWLIYAKVWSASFCLNFVFNFFSDALADLWLNLVTFVLSFVLVTFWAVLAVQRYLFRFLNCYGLVQVIWSHILFNQSEVARWRTPVFHLNNNSLRASPHVIVHFYQRKHSFAKSTFP